MIKRGFALAVRALICGLEKSNVTCSGRDWDLSINAFDGLMAEGGTSGLRKGQQR